MKNFKIGDIVRNHVCGCIGVILEKSKTTKEHAQCFWIVEYDGKDANGAPCKFQCDKNESDFMLASEFKYEELLDGWENEG